MEIGWSIVRSYYTSFLFQPLVSSQPPLFLLSVTGSASWRPKYFVDGPGVRPFFRKFPPNFSAWPKRGGFGGWLFKVLKKKWMSMWEAGKTQYNWGALWDIGIVFRSSLYCFTVFGAYTYDMVTNGTVITVFMAFWAFNSFFSAWFRFFLVSWDRMD